MRQTKNDKKIELNEENIRFVLIYYQKYIKMNLKDKFYVLL
jgi:hypothetical protein